MKKQVTKAMAPVGWKLWGWGDSVTSWPSPLLSYPFFDSVSWVRYFPRWKRFHFIAFRWCVADVMGLLVAVVLMCIVWPLSLRPTGCA